MRSAALVLVLLVGCKRYDREALEAVCSGAGYEHAAAYDTNATGGGEVPLAMVYKYAEIRDWTLNTPARFQRAGVVAPSKDNHQRVALALCVEQKPGPFALDCTMDSFDSRIEVGGGEPKVDVKKTGRTTTVKAHDSHYTVTVREAKTGRVLATRELDVKPLHCPTIVLDHGNVDYATIDEQELVSALVPHLPQAVAARLENTPRD